MHDISSNISPAISLAPAARNASANGSAVDLAGFDGASVLFGLGAYTDGTHTPKVQESTDGGSTWTDVAAADLVGSLTVVSSSAGQNAVQRIGYIGNAAKIRGVITVSGATTGMLTSAIVVRGLPLYRPAA